MQTASTENPIEMAYVALDEAFSGAKSLADVKAAFRLARDYVEKDVLEPEELVEIKISHLDHLRQAASVRAHNGAMS